MAVRGDWWETGNGHCGEDGCIAYAPGLVWVGIDTPKWGACTLLWGWFGCRGKAERLERNDRNLGWEGGLFHGGYVERSVNNNVLWHVSLRLLQAGVTMSVFTASVYCSGWWYVTGWLQQLGDLSTRVTHCLCPTTTHLSLSLQPSIAQLHSPTRNVYCMLCA